MVDVEGEGGLDGGAALVQEVPEGLFAQRGAEGEEGSQLFGGERGGVRGAGGREGLRAQGGGGVGGDPALGEPPGGGRAQGGDLAVEGARTGGGGAVGGGGLETGGGVGAVEQGEREDRRAGSAPFRADGGGPVGERPGPGVEGDPVDAAGAGAEAGGGQVALGGDRVLDGGLMVIGLALSAVNEECQVGSA
ncbi:hypothetical protein ACFQ0M_22610 [Kitasatospora aburaviensis]